MPPYSAEELRQIAGQLPASFIESAPVSRPTAVDRIGGVVGLIECCSENVAFERDPHGIIRFVVSDVEDEWIEMGQIEDLTAGPLDFEVRHGRSVRIFHNS